jgi:hypothetical protein
MNRTLDWVDKPGGIKESHWIDLISDVDEDGLYWWKCYVTWDGCVQIDRAFNRPFGEEGRENDHMALEDGMHICDLDEFIERLMKLRDAAKAHFGQDWPR